MKNFVYRVNDGEKMGDIARRFDTTVQSIVSDNMLDGPETYEGQRILITKREGQRYVVGPFENIESIAKKFGKTRQEILRNNKLPDYAEVFIGQIVYI